MVVGIIPNPNSAYGATTLNQTAVPEGREVQVSGTVLKGDVLVWDTQSTDIAPTVHSADVSADDVALIAGVALESGVAADSVMVNRSGPCLVNIGDGSVSAGQSAGFHATSDGCADNETTGAATFGVFMGGEIGTTNQAVLDVRLAPPSSGTGSVATADVATSAITGVKIDPGFLDVYSVDGQDETGDATYTVTGVAVGDTVTAVLHLTTKASVATVAVLAPTLYTITATDEITAGTPANRANNQLIFFILDRT